MSLEQSVTEAPNEGISIPGEAAPDVQSSQTAPNVQTSPDIEARAREMGWKARHEAPWVPDDKFVSADEFVRKGEEVLPIVNARLRREQEARRELESRLNGVEDRMGREFADRIRRMEGMTAVALKKQREQLWGQFEGEKRKAVEAGDVREFDRLTSEQRNAMASFRPAEEAEAMAPAPEPVPQRQQAPHPAAAAFVERNQWFLRDKALAAVAEDYHTRLFNERPGITVEDNLAATERYIRDKFPEKFGSPSKPNNVNGNGVQPHAPAVEGGNRSGGSARDRGINDLPPEAKQAGAKFITQGLYKDMKEYAADYWAQG